MLQGRRLFKLCQNLPAGHGVAGVQATLAVLEPTYQALGCRDAGCLSGVRTFLLGNVLQGCRLLKWSLFLPGWYCVAGVQSV